jgi:hypothetical protein
MEGLQPGVYLLYTVEHHVFIYFGVIDQLFYYKTRLSLSKLYYKNCYRPKLMIATNCMYFATLRTNDNLDLNEFLKIFIFNHA